MRMIRRWMGFAAAGVFATAPALADVHVAFDPAAGVVECGDTIAVDVAVDASAVDLRGFSLVIGFDPAVVEVESVSAGSLLTGAGCPYFLYPVLSAGADSVMIDGAGLGCSVGGPGAIATILFRALPQAGTLTQTPLVWRNIILRDGVNATIPSVGDPGTVDVTCGQVHVGLDPPDGVIECEGALSVDITVDATATDLRGFSVVLGFDPTVVFVESVFAGPLLTDATCPHILFPSFPAGADSVAIDGAALGCSVTGPGTVASIVFRALPQGTYPVQSPLTWRSILLRDGSNATIPSVGEPGVIVVTCDGIGVEPRSWARTKASYRDGVSP